MRIAIIGTTRWTLATGWSHQVCTTIARRWEHSDFPENMSGMTVLDVGSATGFFAFEFERRGARVISVELPSLRDLDRFPGQDVESSLRKIESMGQFRAPGIFRTRSLLVSARRPVPLLPGAPGFAGGALLFDDLQSHPGAHRSA